jgi:hypothetical protein
MKRSEMVEHIRDMLIATIGEYTSESEASQLLDKLEKLGMTPPDFIYGKITCDITGRVYTTLKSGWEQE